MHIGCRAHPPENLSTLIAIWNAATQVPSINAVPSSEPVFELEVVTGCHGVCKCSLDTIAIILVNAPEPQGAVGRDRRLMGEFGPAGIRKVKISVCISGPDDMSDRIGKHLKALVVLEELSACRGALARRAHAEHATYSPVHDATQSNDLNASTTSGSKCVPLPARMSSMAAFSGHALR